MFRKTLAVSLALLLALSMAACGKKEENAESQSTGDAEVQQENPLVEGNITAAIGETYSTAWFDVTVDSIETVDSYADYTPQTGHKLVDVTVTETSTFDQPVDAGYSDFAVDHDSFEEYLRPMEPLDNTMMPAIFSLNPEGTVNYHLVFEVPETATDLTLIYTEIDTQDNIGTTFSIPFTL